ncbi:MAG: undecaprenyl diphosphate synthase family protein, partial [Bdellovibrionota bacterium]
AARTLAQDVLSGRMKVEDITEAALESKLQTAGHLDPDLIIRTSGEYRLSNFMLWQAAYSEIYVTKTLWPDFDEHELQLALNEYSRRERRFGKTTAQNVETTTSQESASK